MDLRRIWKIITLILAIFFLLHAFGFIRVIEASNITKFFIPTDEKSKTLFTIYYVFILLALITLIRISVYFRENDKKSPALDNIRAVIINLFFQLVYFYKLMIYIILAVPATFIILLIRFLVLKEVIPTGPYSASYFLQSLVSSYFFVFLFLLFLDFSTDWFITSLRKISSKIVSFAIKRTVKNLNIQTNYKYHGKSKK